MIFFFFLLNTVGVSVNWMLRNTLKSQKFLNFDFTAMAVERSFIH